MLVVALLAERRSYRVGGRDCCVAVWQAGSVVFCWPQVVGRSEIAGPPPLDRINLVPVFELASFEV
ncbi:hypothetical protein J2X48_004986 [Bosea sp. BE271]|nr:hypothetical protein [Bosea robiniae]MDR6897954.1 hypothetical protein [Bosea sp. BE109]MDR7141373.1 hypothetical protein [Bosea sp. BE168]MDR7178035.1 hypothetical protein [Bosea sp. BE271]